MSAALEQALSDLHHTRAALTTHRSPAFASRLDALREWQARQVAALHAPLAERYDGHALLHFLTRSFYREADWSELTDDPSRTAARVGKILNDDRPLVIAVRLQQSADALDGEIADALLERDADAAITPVRYLRAFRTVGQADRRAQQIVWVRELVDLLAGYADNRAAYWAFKVAGSPAKAFGMGATYALLAEGFAAMRSTRDLETATHEAVVRQHRELERMLGHAVDTPA